MKEKEKEQEKNAGAKDMTQPAMQMQKLEALGRFAGGIAHDFNNILSIIEGHAHIALRHLGEGGPAATQIEKILQSTQRGAALTRQLLAFARQKVDVEQKTDLSRCLRGYDVLLRPILGGAVKLHISVPDVPVVAGISGDQIAQIAVNLALNARDAMPRGGEFVIELRPPGSAAVPPSLARKHPGVDFASICFTDNGTGMSEAVMARIFEPFFTTRNADRGTGLGLSVVYGILDQVGGQASVWSKEGAGTIIDVWLPLAGGETADELEFADAAGRGPPSLKGRTILVAEDEPELRDVLAMMFDGMEMTVLTASNGNEALLVQEEYAGEIDFLLTDVVMPGMDGTHLGALFSSARPDSNVVYMSGYPFLDASSAYTLPENADFLSKPLREDKVRKILERALERRNKRLETGGEGE